MKNIFLVLILSFYSGISYPQGALDILGRPPVYNFENFKNHLNQGALAPSKMNFEGEIIREAKINLKKNQFNIFLDWYRSSFFYDRNEIYMELLKKKANKLLNPKPYDKEGQRPFDGYLAARENLKAINLNALNTNHLMNLQRILLSKDSIRAGDLKLFLLDQKIKTNSENTANEFLGKIRTQMVVWNQGNSPLNDGIDFYLLNGEKLNVPRDINEIERVNPILKFNSATKAVSFYLPKNETDILNKISDLLEDLKDDLKSSKIKDDIIVATAKFQRDFISIHPFANGNGRLARLLTERILAEYGIPNPIYTYFGYEVTIPEKDFIKIFRDSVFLGYKFSTDVYTLLTQNWGYDLVSSHFLTPIFQPQIREIVPFEFIAWSILTKPRPNINNIPDGVTEFINWRRNQTNDSMLAEFKKLKLNSGVIPKFDVLINMYSGKAPLPTPVLPAQKAQEIPNRPLPPRPITADPMKTFDGKSYGRKTISEYCKNEKYGNHPIVILENTKKKLGAYNVYELEPSCMPGITFTWLNDNFLNFLIEGYGKNSRTWKTFFSTSFVGSSPNALFTSFSPIATAGYGQFQVRLKLKKGIKYYFIKFVKGKNIEDMDIYDACNFLPQNMKLDGVIVRSFKRPGGFNYVEYNFCSMEPVHSWSFDRKETYDETLKEYTFVMDNQGKPNHILYRHYKGIPEIFFMVDKINFTEEMLKERLFSTHKRILNREGEIFINPDLNPRENRDHYYTPNPVYWNKYSP